MGTVLLADPVETKTVAQTAEHSHEKHGRRLSNAAEVVEMTDVETLMKSAFDAPGTAIELEPIKSVELFGRQAGEEFDRIGLFAIGDADETSGLCGQGKASAFGRDGHAGQSSDFVPTFVELTAGSEL